MPEARGCRESDRPPGRRGDPSGERAGLIPGAPAADGGTLRPDGSAAGSTAAVTPAQAKHDAAPIRPAACVWCTTTGRLVQRDPASGSRPPPRGDKTRAGGSSAAPAHEPLTPQGRPASTGRVPRVPAVGGPAGRTASGGPPPAARARRLPLDHRSAVPLPRGGASSSSSTRPGDRSGPGRSFPLGRQVLATIDLLMRDATTPLDSPPGCSVPDPDTYSSTTVLADWLGLRDHAALSEGRGGGRSEFFGVSGVLFAVDGPADV